MAAGQGAGGVGHQVGGAGEGEDRAVVVGVAVQVEQGGAGGGGQVGEDRLVAALADVDHALEEHGASVARRAGVAAPARGAWPAVEGLLGGDGV